MRLICLLYGEVKEGDCDCDFGGFGEWVGSLFAYGVELGHDVTKP